MATDKVISLTELRAKSTKRPSNLIFQIDEETSLVLTAITAMSDTQRDAFFEALGHLGELVSDMSDEIADTDTAPDSPELDGEDDFDMSNFREVLASMRDMFGESADAISAAAGGVISAAALDKGALAIALPQLDLFDRIDLVEEYMGTVGQGEASASA